MNPAVLAVPNARADKALRGRFVLIVGLMVGLALVVVRQPMLAGLPGYAWAISVLLGAVTIAWRTGIFARAHALLRLGAIRRDGLLATQKLNAGDVAGARVLFEGLLVQARPLGAFHAVHVLMYGVTRFFEGDTKEGLALAARAIDSGWFDVRQTREVRDAAETWRVLMLLAAGEVKEARRRVDAASKHSLLTAALAVSAHEKDWDAVIAEATRILALPEAQFPKAGRPTVAGLGRYAAKKKSATAEPFERVLGSEPLGELARKNPALKRFLGEA
jgi:hypothetical protein